MHSINLKWQWFSVKLNKCPILWFIQSQNGVKHLFATIIDFEWSIRSTHVSLHPTRMHCNAQNAICLQINAHCFCCHIQCSLGHAICITSARAHIFDWTNAWAHVNDRCSLHSHRFCDIEFGCFLQKWNECLETWCLCKCKSNKIFQMFDSIGSIKKKKSMKRTNLCHHNWCYGIRLKNASQFIVGDGV